MNLQIKKISSCIKLLCLALITIAGSSQLQAQEGEHTSFLLDRLKDNKIERAMNYLSAGYTKADRDDIRKRIKDNGGNVMYIYLANQNDGTKESGFKDANINPYTSWINFGNNNKLDKNKLKTWKVLIQEVIDDDLKPIFWLLADDSDRLIEKDFTNIINNKVGKTTVSEFESYFNSMVDHFDDLAHSYVIGLEVDEYMSRGTAHGLANKLESRIGEKSIGIHLSARRHDTAANRHTDRQQAIAWIDSPSIDTYYHQYDFLKTKNGQKLDELKAIGSSLTTEIVRQETEYYLGNSAITKKRFVAAEYCIRSEVKLCQRLGDAAIAGGAQHTGNGRTPPVIVEPEQKSTFIRYKKYLIPTQ